MIFFIKKQLRFLVFIIISSLVLSGCKTVQSVALDDKAFLFRRGIVSLENNELFFKACYLDRKEKIHDKTGRLIKRFERTQASIFYAELTGEKVDQSMPWQVKHVHLMGGGQSTCSYELIGNKYRAAGEDPLWIVDVKENALHVQDYRRLSQLIFPKVDINRHGSQIEWRSHLAERGAFTVELILKKQGCRDQFDIEYEYTSKMILNGKVFTGCAREGDLERRSLPGLYTSLLTAGKGLERFISLDLASDASAILTQDYRNRQPLIVQKGTWEYFSAGKIVLHLTEIDGREDNELLILQRDKRGALVIKGYSATYGSKGLRLKKIGPERVYRRFTH